MKFAYLQKTCNVPLNWTHYWWSCSVFSLLMSWLSKFVKKATTKCSILFTQIIFVFSSVISATNHHPTTEHTIQNPTTSTRLSLKINKLHTADHTALGSVFGTGAGDSGITLNQIRHNKARFTKSFPNKRQHALRGLAVTANRNDCTPCWPHHAFHSRWLPDWDTGRRWRKTVQRASDHSQQWQWNSTVMRTTVCTQCTRQSVFYGLSMYQANHSPPQPTVPLCRHHFPGCHCFSNPVKVRHQKTVNLPLQTRQLTPHLKMDHCTCRTSPRVTEMLPSQTNLLSATILVVRFGKLVHIQQHHGRTLLRNSPKGG